MCTDLSMKIFTGKSSTKWLLFLKKKNFHEVIPLEYKIENSGEDLVSNMV